INARAKRTFALDLIVFSSLIIMGLYHLGLYMSRRKDTSAFHFGIFCILIALRTISTNELILYEAFPFLPFTIFHRIEFISFYYGGFSFALFINSLYPGEFSKKILFFIGLFEIPASLSAIFFSMKVYSFFLIYNQYLILLVIFYTLYVLILAAFRNKVGAKLFLLGFSLFSVSLISDITRSLGLNQLPALASYGLLIFVLFQATVLSRRFANTFHQSEMLSEELRKFSSNLESKIEERTLELVTLNEISRTVNRSNNIQAIIDWTMNHISKNYDIDMFTLSMVEADRLSAKVLYFNLPPNSDIDELNKFVYSIRIPLNDIDHVHGYVFHTKQALYTKELVESKRDFEKKLIEIFQFRSYFCLPLILKEEVIGFLGLSNFGREMILSESEIESLKKIADQITGAVYNSKLLEESERVKNEIQSLNEITKNINSVSTLTDIMSFVMYYLETDLDYKDFWLILPDKNRNEFRTFSFVSNSLKKSAIDSIKSWSAPINEQTGFIYETFNSQQFYFFEFNDFDTFTPTDQWILETTNWKYFLLLPLVIYGEVIGILSINKQLTNESILPEEIERLINFSDQIAGAIANAQILKESEEAKKSAEVEKEKADLARKEIEYINEFAKVINSERSLDNIFSFAVDNLKQKFDANIFWLQLVTRDKLRLFTRCLISNELEDSTIQKYKNLNAELKPELGSMYLTYFMKKTFYLRDVTQINIDNMSEIDREITEALKIKSVLQIPLLVQNEVIGILHINKIHGMQKFNKQDIKFIESFSEQLAIAVNNSFLYEEVESKREEAEIEKKIAVMAQLEAEKERDKSERLLLNILPRQVAKELKEKGFSAPVYFESATVLFTDFKGFTQIAETMSPVDLVKELDSCFGQFDKVTERYGLEKLKTIGDSYMCAGGIPKANKTHAIDAILAALEIQNFMNQMKEIKEIIGAPYWELRLGIHTGPLIAGVIGEKKFAYDVWGDAVNTASRMESSGTPGKINISQSTYELIKDFFSCELRGKIQAKNKGEINMYFVNGIKEDLSTEGSIPNSKFWNLYAKI
ncbi:MAG TPA: adenylate/guanylate cyclase domain-containing protein, partial [Leptospiraceae bacterium]|nr:adenylate/guanylate cyclase domain-containing protein [Leptospiraceae bacterium]